LSTKKHFTQKNIATIFFIDKFLEINIIGL